MSISPRVSVITPTCDRPEGLRLCEKWVARQTVEPHEWIVQDGSGEPPGTFNFLANVVLALQRVTGDIVVVFEDDDWYAPEHVASCVDRLGFGGDIAGSSCSRYYNVKWRKYRTMRNKGATFAQTAFRATLIPTVIDVAFDCMDARSYSLDGRLWNRALSSIDHTLVDYPDYVVNIKGLPGTAGIGIGHRPDFQWSDDHDMRQLRAWVGDDAEAYADWCRMPPVFAGYKWGKWRILEKMTEEPVLDEIGRPLDGGGCRGKRDAERAISRLMG